MAKALLTALSGRASTSKSTDSGNEKSQIGSSTTATAMRSNRRHRFDDKSGPPPPRGSLTNDKLSYLDWRLKRINNVRHKSEGTAYCWIDGRDTIGRTSIDVGRCTRAETVVQQQQQPAAATVAAPAPAIPQPATMMSSRTAAIYANEKAAGLKALEHAFAADSVLASMPYLAKRDSSSGSEMSGSSDQHASDAPAAVLDATSDRDVGRVYFTRPRKSFLARAGSHFARRKPSTLATKTETACHDLTDSRSTSRIHRSSFARIWNR